MTNAKAESVMESSDEKAEPEEMRDANSDACSSKDLYGDDISSGLSVRSVTPEYDNPRKILQENSDDSNDFLNHIRIKMNVISDDDTEEQPKPSAENTEHSIIQEIKNPEEQLLKEFKPNDDDISSGLSVRSVTPEYENLRKNLQENSDYSNDLLNHNGIKKNVISDDDADEQPKPSAENTEHFIIQEIKNPVEQLLKEVKHNDSDDANDFLNHKRTKKNVISDDDSDERPKQSTENTEHSISQKIKIEEQLSKEHKCSGTEVKNENRMDWDDNSSSDEDVPIKKEFKYFSRHSVKRPDRKQTPRYRANIFQLSSDSEDSIEDAKRPIKKHHYESPPPLAQDSKSQIPIPDTKPIVEEGVIHHIGTAAEALQRAILAYEQLQKETMMAEEKLDRDSASSMSTSDEENDYLLKGMPFRKMGKKAQETFDRQQSLTVERLEDLHGSLLNRPKEDQRAKDPRGLTVPLMPHQQHALAWLNWREEQNPPGGVLADDMGLGKTLTMISLVVASVAKQRANANDDSDSDSDSGWKSNVRQRKPLGGTLVVAPASLLAQWESEIKNRCVRGLLSVEVYHGTNIKDIAKRMAKTNIVITSYNRVTREYKMSGALYKIRWQRVILDEAHVIRNHKSQTCDSVCGLDANKRWALTGTPIHNKELDLYSILKFLRCSPFDDVQVFKRWVDNRNTAGHERLGTVMKTLMLRRTKVELQAKGELEVMPDKNIEVIQVELDQEERNVYDKVMVYSRTLFAQFLTQRDKKRLLAMGVHNYINPNFDAAYRATKFTKAQDQLLAQHADVKAHEILVLLLRLRQVCCHPPLINSMLDQDDIELAAFDEAVGDTNSLFKLPKSDDPDMKFEMEDQEGDIGVDEKVRQHLLTSDNPVFNPNRQCSKIRAVLSKVKEILSEGDKIIIVSQWVRVLNVLADQLKNIRGATYAMYTGKVPVADRQSIVDDFNSEDSKADILLLSLTAGGVGLNLVGANHLLLIDIHWNPQLESQAQDRIYRVGQKKNVFIYKYLCTDTIEERIQDLQEKKLAIAASVLSGGGIVNTRLTLDDIRTLFNL